MPWVPGMFLHSSRCQGPHCQGEIENAAVHSDNEEEHEEFDPRACWLMEQCPCLCFRARVILIVYHPRPLAFNISVSNYVLHSYVPEKDRTVILDLYIIHFYFLCFSLQFLKSRLLYLWASLILPEELDQKN